MGLDFNVIAQIAESPEQAAGGLGFVPAVEMKGAEVVVLDPVAQDVEGSGHHGRSDGEDCFLGPPSGFDAEELGPKVAILRAYGCPRGGDESGFEPVRALSHTRGSPFPGTLVVSRTKTGPGDEVPRGGEARDMSTPISATMT